MAQSIGHNDAQGPSHPRENSSQEQIGTITTKMKFLDTKDHLNL